MKIKSSMIRMSIRVWLLCGIMSVATLPIAAYEILVGENRDPDGIVTVGGITWKYIYSWQGGADTPVDLSGGYKWNDNGGCTFWRAIPTSTIGAITIPSMLNGHPVERICIAAFYDCKGLTSVTIPSGVYEIGDLAFDGCSGLTSVTIPNSVTRIGNTPFYGCSSLTSIKVASDNDFYKSVSGLVLSKDGERLVTVAGGLTSVTIPDGVTSIAESAFEGCSGLTSVLISDGVTSIESYAFWYCSGLTSVSIPSSVMSIGEEAFEKTALAAVYVSKGDTDRVKTLLSGSGYDVSGVRFVEGTMPISETPDPVTPDPVTPDSVTPGYEVIEATDISAPYEAPKVVTLQGAMYDGGDVVGIVELKLGKVNAKKKTSKISGSVTTLDGKKHKITAFNLTEIDGTTPKAVSLEVKDFGAMAITIGGTQFAGALGKYHVQSAVVGGNATGTGTKVYVDAGGASGGRALPQGTLEELLPDGEPVVASGGKWKFAKAASVKWAKPKKGAALPERYNAESGKGLVVDTSAGKTNLSAMKLTYTPKKGTFKGSFKVYALEGEGKATKLKKYTVKVSGVVVGGVGYGTATCKAPAVNWAVTVK